MQKAVVAAAMQTREPDQLQIRRLPSLNAGLQLDRLTVQTPGGQRTLCQVVSVRLPFLCGLFIPSSFSLLVCFSTCSQCANLHLHVNAL